MSILIVQAGSTIRFDPSDSRTVQFDWDTDNLAAGVSILTSTFTLTVVRQSGLTALTKDNPSILAGLRKTQVRVIATTATAGDLYELANTVVTDEVPAQTKEQSVRVLVENQ